MELKDVVSEGSFLSTMHFHGVIVQYKDDTILFYQDSWGENDSGFMKIPVADMIDSIEASEYVERRYEYI